MDRMVGEGGRILDGIRLVHHDFERDPSLPFESDFFDAVTMLAVFEHIEPAPLAELLREIRRVLRPGGTLVLTTPASWTDPILRALARLGLVSREEIDEHKDAYDLPRVVRLLTEAGFSPDRIRTGTFELGMNLWAAATA
jgi:SAM-dependent methyltransferase